MCGNWDDLVCCVHYSKKCVIILLYRSIEVYDKDAIATIMSIAIKSIQEEIPTITDEGAKRMRSIESSYWGSLATLLEDKAEAEHQDTE